MSGKFIDNQNQNNDNTGYKGLHRTVKAQLNHQIADDLNNGDAHKAHSHGPFAAGHLNAADYNSADSGDINIVAHIVSGSVITHHQQNGTYRAAKPAN
jgi:hypothetical protein